MASQKIGNFEINVWHSGYPVWCHLSHSGHELKFTHTELRDLEYAVKRLLRQAEDGLPAHYKHEVAP